MIMKFRLSLFLFCVISTTFAVDGWRESFETSVGDWEADSKSTLKSISADAGAPTEAVTDGESCLELTASNGPDWCQLVVKKDLASEIKRATTLSFDLYVPAESLPADGWAKVQVRLFGGNGPAAVFDLTKEIELDLYTGEGKLYQFSWDYAAEPTFTPDFIWAHIGIVKVASSGTMSPLYIDNIQLNDANSLEAALRTDAFLLGDEWELIWADEFNGDKGAPPAAHWRPGAIWQKDGMWRDATLAPDEAYLDGKGNLVMRTRYVDGKRLAPYLVTSEEGTYTDEESVTFGPGEGEIFIEWRVNVSQFKAYAAWFALWLFSDTPYTGDPLKGSEIDVMEYVPFEGEQYSLMSLFNAAIHVKDGGLMQASPSTPYGHTKFDEKEWHTWGLYWTKDKQVFYLDGKPYWVNTQYVSPTDDHGLRMTIEIANGDPAKGNKNHWGHAVGKFEDNPEERLPSYAYIDYVRVFKKVPQVDSDVLTLN